MKKWRTKLPLPGIPAGTVLKKYNEAGAWHVTLDHNKSIGARVYHESFLRDFPDFFEEFEEVELNPAQLKHIDGSVIDGSDCINGVMIRNKKVVDIFFEKKFGIVVCAHGKIWAQGGNRCLECTDFHS